MASAARGSSTTQAARRRLRTQDLDLLAHLGRGLLRPAAGTTGGCRSRPRSQAVISGTARELTPAASCSCRSWPPGRAGHQHGETPAAVEMAAISGRRRLRKDARAEDRSGGVSSGLQDLDRAAASAHAAPGDHPHQLDARQRATIGLRRREGLLDSEPSSKRMGPSRPWHLQVDLGRAKLGHGVARLEHEVLVHRAHLDLPAHHPEQLRAGHVRPGHVDAAGVDRRRVAGGSPASRSMSWRREAGGRITHTTWPAVGSSGPCPSVSSVRIEPSPFSPADRAAHLAGQVHASGWNSLTKTETWGLAAAAGQPSESSVTSSNPR